MLLLRAIALATNLFYPLPSSEPRFGRTCGIPTLAMDQCLLYRFLADFWSDSSHTTRSDKIRGHGIPEAIEAILLSKARVDPKVALLKPLSQQQSTMEFRWTVRRGRGQSS